jgi:hypothetical protein
MDQKGLTMKSKKNIQRRRKPKRREVSPLEQSYSRFFVPAKDAIDEQTGGSFEQPSPSRAVRTVVTYSIGEPPLVYFPDA